MIKTLTKVSAIALGAALMIGAPAPLTVPAQATGTHGYANIQSPGESTRSRTVVLPYGKSTVVELPTEMMDIIISDPDVVEGIVHTSHRVMLVGRKPGQANAYIYGHDGAEIVSLEIRVERDVDGLVDLIGRHSPDSQITVQAVNNNIILSGPVPSAAEADKINQLAELWLDEETDGGAKGKIVNLMGIQGRDQVMLKVRIVEMQRSVTKQMGIDLSSAAQIGDGMVALSSNAGLATGAGLSSSFSWLNSGGGAINSLTGAFQALERVGLVRTKAEPTLVAISGETANFQSGGEFPLLSNVYTDQFGQVQRSFTFKPYGVSLGFTPVVLSEGRISLNISTEVSEPTNENSFETGGQSSDILGIRTRKANTVVELPAGKSLVIAGLIREEARQSVDGTPGLKDVPGVGALFRNRDELTSQTELVVIVTPYLVDSTHPDNLSTPLDGLTPPGDREAVLLNRFNKVYARPGANTSGRSLQGPYGHVVE